MKLPQLNSETLLETYILIFKKIYIHTRAYVYMYARVSVCVCVCVCVCMAVCEDRVFFLWVWGSCWLLSRQF